MAVFLLINVILHHCIETNTGSAKVVTLEWFQTLAKTGNTENHGSLEQNYVVDMNCMRSALNLPYHSAGAVPLPTAR